MTAIEITSRPRGAIERLSPETVAALDALAATLPAEPPWQIDLFIGRTFADTIHVQAAQATEPTPEEDAA